MHQFADGLKLFGVLNEVQLEPDVMRPVFTSSTCFKWQAVEFLQNLQVHFSDEGSNLYDKEVDTFKYFSDLVEQMSVRGNLSHISLLIAIYSMYTLPR